MNEKHDTPLSRKSFLLKVSLGLTSLAAAVVAFPVFSALLAPLIERKKQTWRKVAMVDDIPVASTKLVKFENADPMPYAGVTAHTAAWLRRETEKDFIAFSANCTHLGCPVRWEEGAQLFMCPCHGGVYYRNGTVAAGPPPKPLTQYEVRVVNSEVHIKTSPLPITNMTSPT